MIYGTQETWHIPSLEGGGAGENAVSWASPSWAGAKAQTIDSNIIGKNLILVESMNRGGRSLITSSNQVKQRFCGLRRRGIWRGLICNIACLVLNSHTHLIYQGVGALLIRQGVVSLESWAKTMAGSSGTSCLFFG